MQRYVINLLIAIYVFQCPVDKTPEERAQILETTPLFADIHADAASSGQTPVPTNLDTDLHFTCFVQTPPASAPNNGTSEKTMRLIELDGRRTGPVDRGECKDLLLVCYIDRNLKSRIIIDNLAQGCGGNCERCLCFSVFEHAFQHDVSWPTGLINYIALLCIGIQRVESIISLWSLGV